MASADVRTVPVRAPRAPKSGTPLSVSCGSFIEGQAIPMENVFTGCGGKNVSPQLTWSGAPAETKSFAVTCFDPDAPTGSGYWHWLVHDIPRDRTSLDAGAGNGKNPGGGKHARTDYGMSEYGGPCPPKGDIPHRYIFTVYALDVDTLQGVTEATSGATFVFHMMGHVLATGTITATFQH